MVSIFKEAFMGSYGSVKQIAVIVIPLMIFMEILKDVGVLDKIAHMFFPVIKVYDVKKEAGFPLVIGIVIGLSYGAGIILQSAREGKLPKRDLYLLTYFLSACHAIFEDTALFMAFGVSGIWLLTTRLLVAAIFTYAASKWIKQEVIVNEI